MRKYNHNSLPDNRYYTATPVWQNFPWSKIILTFLMITTFLIFAVGGTNDAETVASWTGKVSEIIAGTAIFSIATILLVWAGRILPKNI